MKFVQKMQTQQNVEKHVKCGHFCSNARGKAKLMINFFWPKGIKVSDFLIFTVVSLRIVICATCESHYTVHS